MQYILAFDDFINESAVIKDLSDSFLSDSTVKSFIRDIKDVKKTVNIHDDYDTIVTVSTNRTLFTISKLNDLNDSFNLMAIEASTRFSGCIDLIFEGTKILKYTDEIY